MDREHRRLQCILWVYMTVLGCVTMTIQLELKIFAHNQWRHDIVKQPNVVMSVMQLTHNWCASISITSQWKMIKTELYNICALKIWIWMDHKMATSFSSMKFHLFEQSFYSFLLNSSAWECHFRRKISNYYRERILHVWAHAIQIAKLMGSKMYAEVVCFFLRRKKMFILKMPTVKALLCCTPN